jgi:hypothetical protein
MHIAHAACAAGGAGVLERTKHALPEELPLPAPDELPLPGELLLPPDELPLLDEPALPVEIVLPVEVALLDASSPSPASMASCGAWDATRPPQLIASITTAPAMAKVLVTARPSSGAR